MRIPTLILVLLSVTAVACQEQNPVQSGVELHPSLYSRYEVPPSARQITGLETRDEVLAGIRKRISDYEAKRVTASYESSAMTVLSSNTITVPDPSAGLFTIQDGVNAASPGDNVLVQPGTYTEEILIVTPDVHLSAAGPVTIQGSVAIAAARVTVEGFDIILSGFAAILADGANGVDIRNNAVSGSGVVGILLVNATSEGRIVENTVSGATFGIALADFGGGRPSTNLIVQNTATANTGPGILLQDADFTTVKDNVSSANGGDGILLLRAQDNVLTNNQCSQNWIGIGAVLSQRNSVSRNVCDDNQATGIDLYLSDNNTVGPDNFAARNLIVGISVSSSDANTITDNTSTENGFRGISLTNDADYNQVRGNVSNRNGIQGIVVQGDPGISDGNIIGPNNEANENGEPGFGFGIDLNFGAYDTEVKMNTALGNESCDIYDESNGATGNTFHKNVADCTSGFIASLSY